MPHCLLCFVALCCAVLRCAVLTYAVLCTTCPAGPAPSGYYSPQPAPYGGAHGCHAKPHGGRLLGPALAAGGAGLLGGLLLGDILS